jgi:hypothetical protein
MVSAIGKTQIYTTAWKLIYDIITPDLTDPVSPARDKWVFGSFPDTHIKTIGLPILIIDHVESDGYEETLSGGAKEYSLTVPFKAYATKGISANNLIDQVDYQIRQNENDFRTYGATQFTQDSVESGYEIISKKLVHVYTGNYKFKYLVV